MREPPILVVAPYPVRKKFLPRHFDKTIFEPIRKSKIMVKLIPFLLTLILLTVTACQDGSNSKKEKSHSAIEQTSMPKMDTLFQELADKNKMFGAVAASKKGGFVHNKAYGYAAIKNGDTIPATHQTAYRIGSITKTFTATLFMQLAEAHKVSLSTSLAKFYPKMPNADSITMEHMLRHRSGLHNYTSDSAYQSWSHSKRTKEEMLSYFRDMKSEFSPGETFQYSNTNYVLLAYIMEQITGKLYPELLKTHIIEPLGLERTYFSEQKPRKQEAQSFEWQGNNWGKEDRTHPSTSYGAGGLVSTPADLVKFIHGLFHGQLVDSQTLNQMTNMKKGISPKNGYGLGLLEAPFGNRTSYGHTGGIDGYRAQVGYFPKDSVGFAITSNALNYTFNDIALGMLNILFNKDYQIPEFETNNVTLSAERVARMAGKYSSDEHPLDITLRADSNVLRAQATGQPQFPLTPTSDTSFEFRQARLEIKFKRPKDKDSFQAFYLLQRGKYLFKRQ